MNSYAMTDDLDVLGGLPDPRLNNTRFCYKDAFANRGIVSGIELCMLPNGEQLRLDLLERYRILVT